MSGRSPGSVWVLAGVDPSGGAGLHQDLRVLSALGVVAKGIPTCLTVQNIREVRRVVPVEEDVFREMLDALLAVEPPALVKIGLLPEALLVSLRAFLDDLPCGIPVVIDPILRFGSGDPFLDPAPFQKRATRIFPRASLVTPNLPEASVLLGRDVHPDRESLRKAAEEILARYGPEAVYLKGGHASGEVKQDLYVSQGDSLVLTYPSLAVSALHGGGCTLASLVSGCRLRSPLASWPAVVCQAREIFQKALDWESRRDGPSRRTLEAVFLPSTGVLETILPEEFKERDLS